MYLPFGLVTLFLATFSPFQGCHAQELKLNGYRDGAVDRRYDQMAAKMILDTSVALPPHQPSATSILTIITPSPGAVPVEVTQQSQIVTSFIPEMTMCVGPPIGLFPVTTLGPPYLNQSTVYGTTVGGTGSCSTVYATTETTVCATTITGIASKMTVSDCEQDITFSSESGYTLEIPTPVTVNNVEITPPPTLKRMVTYYAAPWQSVTLGEPPKDVDTKICTILDGGNLECESYEEVWQVNVVTLTSTSTSQVDLATTVSGPGLFMVNTIHINVTTTYTSISLSTTMLLETEIETETTSKSTKTATSPPELPESTAYITKTVKHASKPKPQPTTTVLVTSIATVSVGTITRTSARSFPAPMELVVDH